MFSQASLLRAGRLFVPDVAVRGARAFPAIGPSVFHASNPVRTVLHSRREAAWA